MVHTEWSFKRQAEERSTFEAWTSSHGFLLVHDIELSVKYPRKYSLVDQKIQFTIYLLLPSSDLMENKNIVRWSQHLVKIHHQRTQMKSRMHALLDTLDFFYEPLEVVDARYTWTTGNDERVKRDYTFNG
ncbi:hypothetical protein V1478_007231 [Vespula squamosa]|uniref:Uncharacterized protein n=1 Tax=Vespula squamosa TaxID=30214 RepID=A0ABD2B2M8_VESSQ